MKASSSSLFLMPLSLCLTMDIDTPLIAGAPPQITTQPQSQDVFAEYYASFSVIATGDPTPAYQWRFNRTNLLNATDSTLELYYVTTNDAGDYTVAVSNSSGSVTSAVAVLTVKVEAPLITLQPTNQAASLGASVQFVARATGHPTPDWDWRWNGLSLGRGNAGSGGGTVETYMNVSVGLADAGEYTIVCSNFLGAVTSAVATLTVREQSPSFPKQPSHQSAFVGDEVSFVARAVGNPAPAYQWHFHGPPIPDGSNWLVNVGQPLTGETNTVLHLRELTTNAAGFYSVVASNSLGSVTSSVAGLNVTWPGALDRWYWRSPKPQGNHLRGITYGNGLFVGVGLAGTTVSSTDGVSWNSVQVDPANFFWAVTYGNGLFVAVGGNGPIAGVEGRGVIYTSVDGVRWVRRGSGEGRFLYGVAYGDGVFVAVGEAFGSRDRIMTSTDGVTWTGQSTGPSYPLRSLTYGKGRFVAVGLEGHVETSSNGTNWVGDYSGVHADLYGVTYGNERFVAVGYNAILTSLDGHTWTYHGSGGVQYLYLFGVAYGGGKYVAVGYDYGTFSNDGAPAVYTSPTGTNWTRDVPGGRSGLYGIGFGADTFMAVGDDGTLLSSPTASAWTPRTGGASNSLFGVAAGPDALVAVGDFGEVLSSPDGVEWTRRNSATTNLLNAVAWGRSNFVAVGNAGTILTSSDAAGWMSRSVGTNFNLRAITYGLDRFVAVGGRLNPFEGPPPIFTSPDGVTWTSRSSPLGTLNGVAYGNGLFIAVTEYGGVGRSADVITWTNGGGILSGPNLRAASGITFGNGAFVATHYDFGNGGAIVVSQDGLVWNAYYRHPYQHFAAVAYGGGSFVCMGDPEYSFAVTSLDGYGWTPHRSQATSYPYSLAYAKGRFVAVGSGGTILQSGDTRPRLTGHWRGDNFELTVNGGLARPYYLQTAGDVSEATWTDELYFWNVLPATSLVDTSATNFTRRFYRVVSP